MINPKVQVKNENKTLPLQSFKAGVKVLGSVATLNYEQVFVNEREAPLEVTYLLPLDQNITLTRLYMKVGDKEIECDVKEKSAAKQ